ncbi:ATP-grasp domain-containing protein [Bradyrhizobium sp. SZCCHNRI20481]|uniref:ATP-grasp domain-containing protein n=1 Tax=Bradyrhizobium sp. SZCCHNRI20481 TaxID=3057286 RepID=UPI0029169FB2|nr:ATP-grasp domain-containing protein [Bradyrhizobium sp. SZCCHNRI20481]
MSDYGIITGDHNLDMVERAFGERGLAPARIELCLSKSGSPRRADGGCFYDETSFIEAIVSSCDTRRPVCVLSNCIDDDATVVESQLVELLSARAIPFVAHPHRTASIALDKWRTKELCHALGIATPKGYVANSAEEFRADFFAGDDLVVCKRVNGSAGDDQKMIPARGSFAHLDFTAGPYLMEQFIRGHEVSVNVFATKDGLCPMPIMLKGPTRPDNVHALDRVRIIPPQYDGTLHTAVVTACRQLCSALDPNGWLEFEFVVARNELYLFEINARYSGTTRAAHLATGVNPYRIALDYALNGTMPSEFPASHFVAELPMTEILTPAPDDDYIMYSSSRPRPGRLGRQIMVASSLDELLAKIRRYAPVARRDEFQTSVLSYMRSPCL